MAYRSAFENEFSVFNHNLVMIRGISFVIESVYHKRKRSSPFRKTNFGLLIISSPNLESGIFVHRNLPGVQSKEIILVKMRSHDSVSLTTGIRFQIEILFRDSFVICNLINLMIHADFQAFI